MWRGRATGGARVWWTVCVQRALRSPLVVSGTPLPNLGPDRFSGRLCGAIGVPADLARKRGGTSNGRAYLKPTSSTDRFILNLLPHGREGAVKPDCQHGHLRDTGLDSLTLGPQG